MQVCIAVLHDRISEGKEESMFFYYFDRYYWILIVPALLFAIWAQSRVSTTYRKYSQVRSARGMTGGAGVPAYFGRKRAFQIRIEHIAGNLTDHYDPRANVIRLSDTVYNSTSVAAIGVAAHEAGHAVQYAVGYVPIRIRSAVIPISQFGSSLSMPVLLVGLLFNYGFLVQLGIVLFSTVALFQLVTLPVEFNASARRCTRWKAPTSWNPTRSRWPARCCGQLH